MVYQKLDKHVLDNSEGGGGLEIRVDGYKDNPACPGEAQIFIEIYEGKLRVIAWNGQEDPKVLEIDPIEGGPNENDSDPYKGHAPISQSLFSL